MTSTFDANHWEFPCCRTASMIPSVAMNDILNGYWANSFSDFGALRANGSITKGNPYDNSTLPDYWARRARQVALAFLHMVSSSGHCIVDQSTCCVSSVCEWQGANTTRLHSDRYLSVSPANRCYKQVPRTLA
eukprot:m.1032333 g.1032333  ORF g.1032333 m.1032333 type:complete len:133 (-) comp24123_c1_seq25:6042-6440(-)